MPAAPTMRRRTWSTTAIRKTVRLGVGWRCQVQPRRAATWSALTSATPKAQPASAPTTASSRSTTTATSVAPGWIADGIFNTGSQIELTRVWSALAAYEHIWNPKWRTAVGRRLCQRRLQRDRHQPHPHEHPGAHWRTAVSRCGAATFGRHLAPGSQQLQPGLQLLGSLYPHPVEPGAAARYRSRS